MTFLFHNRGYIHVSYLAAKLTTAIWNRYMMQEGLGTYGFLRKFFYPKSSLILVYMGLRFFPLSFGGSCPNARSISKRFIFLQGYLARGTFSGSTLTRNCYCLYHFLLANLSCHVFLQHFPLVCELPFISCNLCAECVTEIFNFYVMPWQLFMSVHQSMYVL